jgi:hypothetical protein
MSYIYNLADTWGDGATTFTAIKMNVTDTASSASSLLMDLQVGGASKFKVNKDGRITAQTLTIGLGGQTSVSSNTAFGLEALDSASLTGTGNVAIGLRAAKEVTTGAINNAFGANALRETTTGGNNVGIGTNALRYFNTSNNVGVGIDAARGSTTVANNTGDALTAVGHQALFANTSASNNTAVGFQALGSATTGGLNTAVGHSSMLSTTTGAYNCGFGQDALRTNTTASSNAAFGALALTTSTGGNNSALGAFALRYQTTGASNVGIGTETGDVITTGSRNTIIGTASDPSALDGNDQTVIGEGLTGKGNDTAFIGGTNGAYNEKNVTTWETTSDARIKKNIADYNDGLAVIEALRVRTFEYRTPEEITELPQSAAIDRPGVQLGVIAQEIQEVLPACVTENSTGVLSVSTDPLVWHLVNAVKQLSAEIKAIKGL